MPREHVAGRWTTAGFLMLFLAASASAGTATGGDLARAVKNRLSKEEVIAFNVEVSVRGAEVRLNGEVPSLWHKEWAVEQARGTDGVVSVVSDLTIRDGENPDELARTVADAIRRYPYYTIFDYVNGSIEDSVVTLRGVVTHFPNKPAGLRERVSRVPGVKGVMIDLEVLSPGIGDARVRSTLVRRLYGLPSFHRYLGLDPNIHIIVRNGYVTLKGAILTQGDKILADSVARGTFGVIKVDNQLRTKEERMKAPPQPGAVVIND